MNDGRKGSRTIDDYIFKNEKNILKIDLNFSIENTTQYILI